MVRAALSLDGDGDLMDDTLNALKELACIASDSFKIKMFEDDTVKRLMFLLNKFSCLGMSHMFQLSITLRILGDMICTAGISNGLQTFLECNGLDKLNAIFTTINEK